MSALNRLLAPLAAEFAGNARLRWGVWLILGIVLFYFVLSRSERVVAVHEEYAAEAERLMKAETLLERRDWPELLEAERNIQRELTAAFWQAETEGLAQAKLQAALNGVVEGLRLLDAQVRPGLSRPVPDLPGIWRVQIRLDAPISSGGRAAADPRRRGVFEEAGRRPSGPLPAQAPGLPAGAEPFGLLRGRRGGAGVAPGRIEAVGR